MYSTRKIQFNENLICQAIDESWLSSLAFFGYCKLLYHNNSIYNFNVRMLGEKLKCSHNKVQYHISKLKKAGLIKMLAGNITFTKTEVQHKCSVIINSQDTLTEITKKLQTKIIEQNDRQQEWAIGIKSEIRNLDKPNVFFKTSKLKTLLKHRNSGRFETTLNPIKTLSQKALAKLLSISVNTANKLKKYLNKNEFVFFIKQIKKLLKTSKSFFYSNYAGFTFVYGSVFFSRGFVFKALPCIIKVNEYWKKKEPITSPDK